MPLQQSVKQRRVLQLQGYSRLALTSTAEAACYRMLRRCDAATWFDRESNIASSLRLISSLSSQYETCLSVGELLTNPDVLHYKPISATNAE